jgi:hypothetical protein
LCPTLVNGVLTRLSDARGRTVLSIALVSSLACETGLVLLIKIPFFSLMEAHGQCERDFVSRKQFSRPTSRFLSDQ